VPLHGFLDGENKETVNLRHSTTFVAFSKTMFSRELQF